MFKEKFLIGHSFLDKVKAAVDPRLSTAESYEKSLHSNETSGAWNSEKIEHARAMSVPIASIANATRDNLRKVFVEAPKEIGKGLASLLSRTVFTVPAWIFTKAIQIPQNLTKLVTSGLLVANAELWDKIGAIPRAMISTNDKIHAKLGL